MMDHLEGRGGEEIVERDSGFVSIGAGPELYFAPFESWRTHEREAMPWVGGRVLDVGCGAGRVVLHLQNEGMDVVGFDLSPLAIEVCRRRGAMNVEVRSVSHIGLDLGTFDTVVMLGSNFGLLGSWSRGRRLLRRLASMTTGDARIIATTRDPHATEDDADLAYLQRNKRRGRMPGQWRIRIRYRDLKTPWFDYLTLSRSEMEEMLIGTGWHVTRFLDGPSGRYTAVLVK
jgi:SAM-dependent methyltransferase